MDNGTVPLCFDAASKGGFHSKCLTYPKRYAIVRAKRPAATYQTSCSRRTAPPPPLQNRLEKERKTQQEIITTTTRKRQEEVLILHVHKLSYLKV